MKCEKFSEITQLQEYLYNNQIIAYTYGFDITKKLPSYLTFRRFIKNTAHKWFSAVMQSQVKELTSLGFIDGSFASLDSTSIEANTSCPCKHPKYFNGKKNRGCVKYVSTGTDYRSLINRDSEYFKSIYSLRTESERYNSRWKNLNTDKASVRSLTAIENLNTVGHICLLAIAVAAVKPGKPECLKSLKSFKKSA